MFSGATETQWKLAEEFNGSEIATVTLVELNEANLLGLTFKGDLVL